MLRISVLRKVYRQLAEEEGEAISKEIDHFAQLAQSLYFAEGLNQSERKSLFAKRLSFIIKTCLLQIRIYAQLFKKVKAHDTTVVGETRREAFEFLKFFWLLTLTQYEDAKTNIYCKFKVESLTEEVLQHAKHAFESAEKDIQKIQAVSWHGTGHFLKFKWQFQLTWFVKVLINKHILPNQPEHNKNLVLEKKGRFFRQRIVSTKSKKGVPKSLIYHYVRVLGEIALRDSNFQLHALLVGISKHSRHIQNTFKERKPCYIVERIGYVMAASYLKLQIYFFVRQKGLFPVNLKDFDKKVLPLLQNFCLSAVFDTRQSRDEFSEEDKNVNKFETLEDVKQILGSRGATNEKGESASWIAVSFCLNSLWKEHIRNAEKSSINKKIFELGESSNIPYPPHLQKTNAIDEKGLQIEPLIELR
ncbi:hypothetical protein O181_058959 [Austropuccinia psidii MF-1]|uniref:Uncharacterized protein n=1 Tax=Austropuccinia psidii MF-1 TaxID=1389203 RepID=A0A9Q3EDH8_9BASI|nr:hypothetical protein [Austropuccinia psidii MF-1]